MSTFVLKPLLEASPGWSALIKLIARWASARFTASALILAKFGVFHRHWYLALLPDFSMQLFSDIDVQNALHHANHVGL